MSEFQELIAKTRWAGWTIAPIPNDASSRQYARLSGPQGESVIVMHAQTAPDGETARFVRIARDLKEAGVNVPEILQRGPSLDWLVLSDLGTRDVRSIISAAPERAEEIYRAAVAELVHLAQHPPLPDLPAMTPEVGGDMLKILAPHYISDASAVSRLAAAMSLALEQNCGPADVFSLRDFHAENLIWRDDRHGRDRLGLLDFQDAFVAPLGYDLVSLLRDVRTEVPASIRKACVAQFAAAFDLESARAASCFATLGVQRNLRILGVFARLIRSDGKSKYRAFLPRLWRHLQADLSDPSLDQIRTLVAALLPPPDIAIPPAEASL